MNNQLNSVNSFNTINEEIIDAENKIPFVQKLVFFLVGFSMSLVSLAIWFLFKDEKKYTDKLKYMKNGAIASLILIVVSLVFGFLVGFGGALISANL